MLSPYFAATKIFAPLPVEMNGRNQKFLENPDAVKVSLIKLKIINFGFNTTPALNIFAGIFVADNAWGSHIISILFIFKSLNASKK